MQGLVNSSDIVEDFASMASRLGSLRNFMLSIARVQSAIILEPCVRGHQVCHHKCPEHSTLHWVSLPAFGVLVGTVAALWHPTCLHLSIPPTMAEWKSNLTELCSLKCTCAWSVNVHSHQYNESFLSLKWASCYWPIKAQVLSGI